MSAARKCPKCKTAVSTYAITLHIKRCDPARDEQMRQEHEAGMTVRDIAAEHG